VTDPEEVDLKKDGSNFSESRTELDKHLSPTWKNLVLQKKKKKKRICLPTYPYPKVMGRVWGMTDLKRTDSAW
jgi:hypothetical protein